MCFDEVLVGDELLSTLRSSISARHNMYYPLPHFSLLSHRRCGYASTAILIERRVIDSSQSCSALKIEFKSIDFHRKPENQKTRNCLSTHVMPRMMLQSVTGSRSRNRSNDNGRTAEQTSGLLSVLIVCSDLLQMAVSIQSQPAVVLSDSTSFPIQRY